MDNRQKQTFVVSSDGCCDLVPSYMREHNINFIPMPYVVDGEVKRVQLETDEEFHAFYDMLRNGQMPTTSQVNTQEMQEYFERLTEENEGDILHITLSSGLSGTYASAVSAADAVMSAKPDRKIYIVDSLSAAYGQGLLVDMAVELRDKGYSAAFAHAELNQATKNLQHWIYIDDLKHLRKGGRISAAGAVLGSLLHLKPVLTASPKGMLKVVHKTFGINRAFNQIIDSMKKFFITNQGDKLVDIYVAHADDKTGLARMVELIKKSFKCVVKTGYLGPAIGSHCGPGAMTVYFLGQPRLGT